MRVGDSDLVQDVSAPDSAPVAPGAPSAFVVRPGPRAPGIYSVLSQLDEPGIAAFEPRRWATVKEQLAAKLDFELLQQSMKSMMAGQPLVFVVDGGTVAITAGIKRLQHTGGTAQTEFNSASQRAFDLGSTDGETAYSRGTSWSNALQVLGTTDPGMDGVAGVVGVTGTLVVGFDEIDVHRATARGGKGTKPKVPGAAFAGLVELHVTMLPRRGLLGMPLRGLAQRRIRSLQRKVTELDVAIAHADDVVPAELLSRRAAAADEQTRLIRRTARRIVAGADVSIQTLSEAAESAVVQDAADAVLELPKDGGRPTVHQPAAPKQVYAPPDGVWDQGRYLVRDLPDVGSLHGLLDTFGKTYFGRSWTRRLAGGVTQGGLVRSRFGQQQLMSLLPQLTAGAAATSDRFKVGLSKDADVTVRAELLELTFRRAEPKSEYAPTSDVGGMFSRTRLSTRQVGGFGQVGVQGTLGDAKAQLSLVAGGHRRRRDGGQHGEGGRIVANAKIPTNLVIYDGFVKVEVSFRIGKTTRVEHGVLPVVIQLPASEATLVGEANAAWRFLRPAPAVPAAPVAPLAPAVEVPARLGASDSQAEPVSGVRVGDEGAAAGAMGSSWVAGVVPGERWYVRRAASGGVERVGFAVQTSAGNAGTGSVTLVVRVHPVPARGQRPDVESVERVVEAARESVQSHLSGQPGRGYVLPGGVPLRVVIERTARVDDAHMRVEVAGPGSGGAGGSWSPDMEPRALAADVALRLGLGAAGKPGEAPGPLFGAAHLQLLKDFVVADDQVRPVDGQLRGGFVPADQDPRHDAPRLDYAALDHGLTRFVYRDMSGFDPSVDHGRVPLRDRDGLPGDPAVQPAPADTAAVGRETFAGITHARVALAPGVELERLRRLAVRHPLAYPELVSLTAPEARPAQSGSNTPFTAMSKVVLAPGVTAYLDPAEPAEQRGRRLAAVRSALGMVRAAGYSAEQLGQLDFVLPKYKVPVSVGARGVQASDARVAQYHGPNTIVVGPRLQAADPDLAHVPLGAHEELAEVFRDEHVARIVRAIGRHLADRVDPKRSSGLAGTRFHPEYAMIARNVSLLSGTPGEAMPELFLKHVFGFRLSADEWRLLDGLGGVRPRELGRSAYQGPSNLAGDAFDALVHAVAARLGRAVEAERVRSVYLGLSAGERRLNLALADRVVRSMPVAAPSLLARFDGFDGFDSLVARVNQELRAHGLDGADSVLVGWARAHLVGARAFAGEVAGAVAAGLLRLRDEIVAVMPGEAPNDPETVWQHLVSMVDLFVNTDRGLGRDLVIERVVSRLTQRADGATPHAVEGLDDLLVRVNRELRGLDLADAPGVLVGWAYAYLDGEARTAADPAHRIAATLSRLHGEMVQSMPPASPERSGPAWQQLLDTLGLFGPDGWAVTPENASLRILDRTRRRLPSSVRPATLATGAAAEARRHSLSMKALLLDIKRFDGVSEGARVPSDTESIGSLAAHAVRRRLGDLAAGDEIKLVLDDLAGINILAALQIVQAIATKLDHQVLFQSPRGEALALCPPGKSPA